MEKIRVDEHTFVLPRTSTEMALANIWSELLGIEQIGIHDNFFDLGGHSLLATQLVARIRDRFKVELPVRTIFDHAKLSDLAVAIDEAVSGIALPPIEPLPDEAAKVLSFAQQRLWVLAQFERASASYNMPMAFELDGELHLDALRAALAYLIERHTSLRMSFPEPAPLADSPTRPVAHSLLGGQPQVLIHKPEASRALVIQDLRELDGETQAETVQRLADEHAQYPFDLTKERLFKAELLQLSQRQNVLLINMHHIISDGWSMGVFVREWQHAYAAFAQGQSPTLAPLAVQYSDYAAWQRGWLQGEILESQINYWKEQLSGAPELLELPTDHPRPAQQSHRGAHYQHSLSADLTGAVKRLSRHQGVTPFMTLLTTFNVLLSRYSAQDDLCIGSPIANRTHSHTEDIIGFFVNTLVLRSQINPEHSFTALLQQTRQTCLDAYAHQDIPFEYLVEQLQPKRSLSHPPLFQVMFALQNHVPRYEGNERADLSLPGLSIQRIEQSYPFAKFDLTLSLVEKDNQLHALWEYVTDLFEAQTIQRMAEHFEVLLKAIVQNPEQPISTLPLMTTAEIEQLQAWNATERDYPRELTIVDLFEQQVSKTPNDIAVVFGEQRLTYWQLNQKANQLAHYLIKTHHIQPDTLVGICVERSIDMVIGLLGILKAGGAYVPIDPNYPQERIRFMLEDSATAVLLTQSRLKEQLPLSSLAHPCEVLCLDEESFAEQPTDNPSPQSRAENLVYVIYTSGSTGRPKGVMIEHKGLVNLVLAQIRIFRIRPQSRLLQFASFSFDASVSEICITLCGGARLYVAEKENNCNPKEA